MGIRQSRIEVMEDFNILAQSKKERKRYISHPITRVNEDTTIQMDDAVVIEEPLSINVVYYSGERIFKSSLSITMRTPGNDFDLVRGFLFTEGIIGSTADILKMEASRGTHDAHFQNNTIDVYLSKKVQFAPEELTRHFYTSSSCGVCSKSSVDMVYQQGVYFLSKTLQIDSSALKCILDHQQNRQELFNLTGGNHIAYLFDVQGEIRQSMEDVGRHNALDKLIGHAITSVKLPLKEYGVLVSGRASFELVQKAWLAGIPILCAIGAPSSLAVKLADEVGMTLIGFLKQKGYNIYTHPSRILL